MHLIRVPVLTRTDTSYARHMGSRVRKGFKGRAMHLPIAHRSADPIMATYPATSTYKAQARAQALKLKSHNSEGMSG